MENIKKNVVVIGAGPSGLTAIKGLLEEGHQVICFEKSKDLGGVYRYDPNGIGVYESAQLTSSALITSFSDFPVAPDAPFHLKHDQYFQYLQGYAQGFGLMEHIKFQHKVNHVEHLPEGTWRVKVFNEILGQEEQYIFDAVAVCAGVHQQISIPDIKNKESFKGSIIHSGFYKNAESFKDKNVLIVGGGESGSDIVEEVSKVSKSCILSLRRGILMIPRLTLGIPNDFFVSRLYCTSPQWFLKMRHKSFFHWPTLSLFFLLILLFIGVLVFILGSTEIIALLFLIGFTSFAIYATFKIFQFQQYIGLEESLIIKQLKKESLAGHDEQFATKCHGIARAIAQKKCSLKPAIKSFTTQGVEFVDGTHCDADTVIFCTGYVTTYPFLGIDRLDCRNLYKNCFDPFIGSTLCILGVARPAIGAIPPIAEMQARWFAQILSGNRQLPALDVMQKEIVQDTKMHKDFFAVVSDRITGLVDYSSYMDQLAGFVGCKPRWKDLWKDPVLLFRVHFNPFLACQYRLIGPHPKRELARKTMTSVRLNVFQMLTNSTILCVVLISKILHGLGLKYFKTHLRLG